MVSFILFYLFYWFSVYSLLIYQNIESIEINYGSCHFRFRNGAIPKVVTYIEEGWVRRKWFGAHVKDINNGVCPLPCNVTSNIKEVRIDTHSSFLLGDHIYKYGYDRYQLNV